MCTSGARWLSRFERLAWELYVAVVLLRSRQVIIATYDTQVLWNLLRIGLRRSSSMAGWEMRMFRLS